MGVAPALHQAALHEFWGSALETVCASVPRIYPGWEGPVMRGMRPGDGPSFFSPILCVLSSDHPEHHGDNQGEADGELEDVLLLTWARLMRQSSRAPTKG
jgi:hypothetical protein